MKHPLHALCPYFAMFPADFVLDQLLAYSRPGDLVFDPFSGRGTTVLESLLNNRRVIALDINPVAACVSGAKADVPH
jgi:DNA modification methylase